MMTAFAMVAAAGAAFALISGVTAMACDGEALHRSSAQWMGWRVGLQGAALVLLMLAFTGR